jgi:hypothetical protein
MAEGTGYTLLKWNGQYGRDAKFVVRDNSTGKQSLFTPGALRDVVWSSVDLANTLEMKKWQDFGDETVDNLEDVAM